MRSSRWRCLLAALAYANRDWAIFPLHTPREDGSCDCNRDDCRNIGKHPRTMNGFKDATTDEAQIRKWWGSWPKSNVGVACGASGLVVLDVDPRNGGDESLADLREKHGEDWLNTVVSLTGGGGSHYYYQMPTGQRIRGSKDALGPGLDIKGDDGYVVAPPSLHESGNIYAWERPASKHNILEFPDVMAPRERRGSAPMVGNIIPEGSRDTVLTSLAGSMRHRGMSEAGILAALREENAARCSPPLPDAELGRIARSIVRYEPGRDIPVKATGITSYARLRKIDMVPPVYVIEVCGRDVRVPPAYLANHRALKVAVMAQADVIVPPMKAGEWDATLDHLVNTQEVLPAPEDASEGGIIWSLIQQALLRASDDPEHFFRGKPLQSETHVYTTGSQLRQAMRAHNLSVEQRKLWAAVEAHGGIQRNASINNKQQWVWAVPNEAVTLDNPRNTPPDSRAVEEALE